MKTMKTTAGINMILRLSTAALFIFASAAPNSTAQESESSNPGREFVDSPLVRVKSGHIPNQIPELWQKATVSKHRVEAIVLALNDAREDAIARLQKRLEKVKIEDGKTIADFIRNSDNPAVDLKTFLHGADETGVRLRKDMLICEVEISTNLRTAIACFKGWADDHVNDNKIDITMLNRYVETTRNDISREIGTSAVRPEVVIKSFAAAHEAARKTALKPPSWISQRVVATGKSALDAGAIDREVEKQRAYREAEDKARQLLLKRVYSLKLKKDLTVGGFVDKSTEAANAIKSFCENAPELKAARRIMNRNAEFSVSLNMKTLWNMYVRYTLEEK